MNPALLSMFCGLLLALAAFSIDIMLPAFSSMAEGLGSPIELVQGTVPAFSFPFAVSQLVYGPASDRFGRKPTVVAGLIIFLIGALIVAVAPTIELVLWGRAIQGIGRELDQLSRGLSYVIATVVLNLPAPWRLQWRLSLLDRLLRRLQVFGWQVLEAGGIFLRQ